MSDVQSPLTDPPRIADGRIRRLPFILRAPLPQFAAIETVQRHWEVIRANRVAPARAEIDPRPLAECLDVLFVAELVAPGVARLRLAGQHLADLLGMEPRGMPLTVLFTGAGRDEVATALKQVAQGARAVLPLRSDAGLGQPGLDGMLALLPLTDQSGAITRVLGVLETLGPIGRAPRKFRTTAPLRATLPADAASRPCGGKPVLRLIDGGKA